MFFYFFKLWFIPHKVQQPLEGVELQEQEKDEKSLEKLIR